MKKREIALIVIAVLAVASALYGWYHPKTVEGPTTWVDRTRDVVKTVRVPIVSRQTVTVIVSGETVTTISDCTVLATPDTLEGKPITAKADTPPSKTGFDIESTITPETGETRIFIKEKKRSLFGFENDKEIGARYGLKNEADLFGRWTFFRIGSFYLAGYGQASTHLDQLDRADTNVLLEMSYRW